MKTTYTSVWGGESRRARHAVSRIDALAHRAGLLGYSIGATDVQGSPGDVVPEGELALKVLRKCSFCNKIIVNPSLSFPRSVHSGYECSTPYCKFETVQVKAFTKTVRDLQPIAPITGTTLAERSGLLRVLVNRPSPVMGRVTRVVLDGPTPVPQALYEPRM